MRLAPFALLLAACLPSYRPTAYPHVVASNGSLNGRPCARSYEAEATRVAAATLAELRARKLLLREPQPLQLCILDKAPPIIVGGWPVYGAATPIKSRVMIWVAGRWEHWRTLVAGEVLKSLGYLGLVRGWPRGAKSEAQIVKRDDYQAILKAVAP